MTSRSRFLQFVTWVLPMTVVATFLSVLAAGPASAVLPACNGGGRIVNPNGTSASFSDCTINSNSTGGVGGGVENAGDLHLTNVVISNNSGDAGGGGVYNGPTGTLTLINVVVTGNTTLAFGGGILNDGGSISMNNVTVTSNMAALGGGGIVNSGSANGAELAVASNTTSGGDGGGILNTGSFCVGAGSDFATCLSNQSGGNSLVTGNHATAGSGGGIANDSGSMIVTDSTVDSNHAEGADGGGIWTHGDGTALLNVTISNNTAAGNGGGIVNDAGVVCCGVGLFATNLTIAGNLAAGNGGGVYTSNGGFTALGSSTIADNAAVGGGGLYNDDASGAVTELLNTLLARNGTNCAGSNILSDGHNLDTGATCATFNGPASPTCIANPASCDQTSVGDANVGLGPLAENGGPTQGSSDLSAAMRTQALEPTSPAVDAGSPTCPPPTTDERGVLREIGVCNTACDIGAFELLTTSPPTVTCVQSVNPSGKNIPAAGKNPKSGQNPDGFYQVSATNVCTTGGAISITIGSYTLAQDETIKITQAPGQHGVTLVGTMGSLNIKHFVVGPGDAVITATDGAGNTSTVTCLVPPPPK